MKILYLQRTGHAEWTFITNSRIPLLIKIQKQMCQRLSDEKMSFFDDVFDCSLKTKERSFGTRNIFPQTSSLSAETTSVDTCSTETSFETLLPTSVSEDSTELLSVTWNQILHKNPQKYQRTWHKTVVKTKKSVKNKKSWVFISWHLNILNAPSWRPFYAFFRRVFNLTFWFLFMELFTGN